MTLWDFMIGANNEYIIDLHERHAAAEQRAEEFEDKHGEESAVLEAEVQSLGHEHNILVHANPFVRVDGKPQQIWFCKPYQPVWEYEATHPDMRRVVFVQPEVYPADFPGKTEVVFASQNDER